jgi:hypothetical protein
MPMPWQRCLGWTPSKDACNIRINRQHPSIWEQNYPDKGAHVTELEHPLENRPQSHAQQKSLVRP